MLSSSHSLNYFCRQHTVQTHYPYESCTFKALYAAFLYQGKFG